MAQQYGGRACYQLQDHGGKTATIGDILDEEARELINGTQPMVPCR